jgi:hypothetical protein
VGGSDPVDPKPRSPAALAALLVEPEAARARRRGADTRAEAPSAQPGRRVASLGRTTQQVMALIKADAARREPQHRHPVVLRRDGALGLWRLAPRLFQPWKRGTCVLDLRPVGGDLWGAANAWFGEASQAAKRWGQRQRTEMLRGRVGDVIGGRRPSLTKPRLRQSVRQTRATVITCGHHHRRWLPSDQYLAMGVPVGTGVVESAGGAVVKHRLEGEGQRWSRAGAEALLALRALKKSHDADRRDDWRFHAR